VLGDAVGSLRVGRCIISVISTPDVASGAVVCQVTWGTTGCHALARLSRRWRAKSLALHHACTDSHASALQPQVRAEQKGRPLMLLRFFAASTIAAAALTTMPHGADAQSGFGIGGALGANVPTSDYGNAAGTGVVLNGFLQYRFPSVLALRGELLWSRSDIHNPLIGNFGDVSVPASAGTTGNVNLVGASADAELTLSRTRFQPYLIGGVGVFRRAVDQTVQQAAEDFQHLTDEETDFGYNAGVGVRFHISRLALFAEARYYHVTTAPQATSFVPVTVGVSF